MNIPAAEKNIDLVIFEGRKIIYSSQPRSKHNDYHSYVIKYDPKHELSHEEYKDCYYCTTKSDFQELLDYFFKNPEFFALPESSEDVLDQCDTIRLGNGYKNL